MHDQVGPVVLGALSAVFSGFGLRELVAAYRIPTLPQWTDRAVPGAGGLLVGALFAVMAFHIIG